MQVTDKQSDILDAIVAETTADIINSLKKDVVPWVRPWATWSPSVIIVGANERVDDGSPRNIAGPAIPFIQMNAAILRVRACIKNYRTDFWVSEERIKQLGVAPKDGECPCVIVRYFPDQDVYHAWGNRRLYNLDQIKHLDTLGVHIRPPYGSSANFQFSYKRAKKGLNALNVIIIEGKPEAAYDPAIDIIEMPSIHQFQAQKASKQEAESHYWATLWHEIIHWTGHKNRLCRSSLINRGTHEYAYEELIAEFGSAFLCSHFGIRGRLQYGAYIKDWLRFFEENKETALHNAIKDAEAATCYVRDLVQAAKKEK